MLAFVLFLATVLAMFTLGVSSATTVGVAALYVRRANFRDAVALKRLQTERKLLGEPAVAAPRVLIDPTNRADVHAWNRAVSEVYA